MGLISFPNSGFEDDGRSQSIYGKMYSAATQIFHVFLNEDGNVETQVPQAPGDNANANAQCSATNGLSSHEPPHSPDLSDSDKIRSKVRRKPSQSGSVVERTSVRSKSASIHQVHTSESSRTGSSCNMGPIITSDAGQIDHPEPPKLLRTSTTSSATVGLSQAQAVPQLPTASSACSVDIPSLVPTNYDNAYYSTEDGHDQRRNSIASTTSSMDLPVGSYEGSRPPDVESLFSINSTSASHAYLASQYSRTRSRAAPGWLSREFWMKDKSATSCFSCNRAFTTFRRKHHCRVCGQIFCSACTSLIDGERCGARNRRVRCCKACEEALVSHTSSEDEGDMSFQSHIPDDSLRWSDATTNEDSQLPRSEGFSFPAYNHLSAPYNGNKNVGSRSFPPHESEDSLDTDQESRTEAYSRFGSPAPIDDLHFARSFLGTSHTSHLSRTRSRSVSRSRSQSQFPKDEEMATHTTRSTRSNSQGTSLASPLLPFAAASTASNTYSQLTTPAGFSGSLTSSSTCAVNNATGGALTAGTPSAVTNSNFIPTANMHIGDLFPLSSARFPNSASVELNNASLTYLQLFLDQLLKDSELDPEEWKPILTAPLLEVAAGLHLEINDRVSPREWVKIKRIPGGTPQDIDCINGTVFTHSLARKSMVKKISYPRILLISFPIEYARNDRYMSLEPVIAQEKEYLKKLVARIEALRPSLLLSCSHVCGQAMELLENAGISVAHNVRESALYRLSKITKADILMSIDRLSTAPQLGTCELFEQRSYKFERIVKTFLFFFVRNADPGRCALVRGEPELSAVIKVVLEVMAEICYSLKAETALMRDQFVMVPSLTNLPTTILSSSPFVDYGIPFLQHKCRMLEDEVVRLGNEIDEETDEAHKYILAVKLENTRSEWLDAARTWDSIELAYPFLFNPSSHQNLVVLYSLVSTETATPCVGPDAQLIEFYLNTDQTLGKFVETSINQVNLPCPDECGHHLGDHYRTYVNGAGMVTVHTENMACKVPGLEDSILMWSYCNICEQQMPVVPMSSTTWKCSMGKYLELSFYGEPLKMRASNCHHNVYRDHTRYFGWHGLALKIKYSTVELSEIYGPPKVLKWDPEIEIKCKQTVYDEWIQKLNRFWTSTIESLSKVKVEGLEEKMIERSQTRLDELKQKAENDWKDCISNLNQIYDTCPAYDYLSLNRFLEGYQLSVDQWHADLADFDGQYFPTERDIRRVTAQHIKGLLGEEAEKPKTASPATTPGKPSISSKDVGENSQKSGKTQGIDETPKAPTLKVPKSDSKEMTQEVARSVPASGSQVNDLMMDKRETKAGPWKDEREEAEQRSSEKDSESSRSSCQSEGAASSPSSPSVKVKSKFGNDINLFMPNLNQSSIRDGGGRVAILARHFEELSQEFEKERQREQQRLRERQKAIQLRHAHPIAEVFEDVSDAIEDWPQSQQQQSRPTHARSQSQPFAQTFSSSSHVQPSQNNKDGQSLKADSISRASRVIQEDSADSDSSRSNDNTARISSALDGLSLKPTIGPEAVEEDKVAEEIKKAEPVRLSLIKTLANFWAERSSTRWNGIEYLLGTRQHYFTNSPVVLRETEPSSLIAFCLSLPDYQARVNEFYNSTPGAPADSSLFDSNRMNDDSDVGGSEPSLPKSEHILENAMLRQTGTHMRYHFDRNTVKVSCKIFFSEQFDALRRKCTAPDKYIQSLSRCSSWESTGGKSGSAFLKTLDDRLILKELSHAEFDSFVTFAPSYFEYMSQALFHDLPTVLAKIFGVYQITLRNSQNAQQVKMYVLVMENLFYGCKFSKFFDLKGSMRNRKVTETGKANEVLLDENMVEFIYETPVFVREHSKRMLRASLYNDTLFLTKMNVMDYSLVIGLDDDRNVIVAGIIDYIRTYTWDKKIESWVKTRAATVGIKEPTVVSPKQYKGRFRESMERYFVMVPDCWSQQSV